MNHRITIYAGGLLLLALTTVRAQAQIVATQNPTEITVLDATTVFAQAMAGQDTQIPRSVLANAQGIAIVPGMVRGAFVVGLQYGKGVLVTRDPAGNWQTPRMIQMAGGSFGYQIGVQATDLILVFRTPQSVANVLNGTLKVGVDASAACCSDHAWPVSRCWAPGAHCNGRPNGRLRWQVCSRRMADRTSQKNTRRSAWPQAPSSAHSSRP